jgi:hypothetical protein
MSQDFVAQQDSLAAGGNATYSTTTGYATGTICGRSGNYRASNKYMDIVVAYAKGDIFLAGPDGKKTTWYALTASLSTNKDGSFSSVKVAPGSI